MNEVYLHIVFVLEMFRQTLSAIDGAVLPARTAEAYLQVRKAALHKPLHMMVNQGIYRLQERQYFPVFLQEVYHRFVHSGQCLVFVVLTGVVCTTAVEHIASTVSALVRRDATFKGEGVNRY